MSLNAPKISVVSPCLNCVALVRRCIESVRSQDYKNVEHIVVDGVSTDGTVEVLREYPHLQWLSEKDSGEAEALNKALRMATGDIVTWLNVDDSYIGNDVLSLIVSAAAANPAKDIFYANVFQTNDLEQFALVRAPVVPLTLNSAMRWWVDLNTFQPAIFYRAEAMKKLGFFREDLHFGIDLEYMMRSLAQGCQYSYVDAVVANATLFRTGAKSGASREDQHKVWYDLCRDYQRYLASDAERRFYWRDYYAHRIRNSSSYTQAVELPVDRIEMQGMITAILEFDVLNNAAVVAGQMMERFPEEPETFWFLSEIYYKAGEVERSQEMLRRGTELELRRRR